MRKYKDYKGNIYLIDSTEIHLRHKGIWVQRDYTKINHFIRKVLYKFISILYKLN